MQRRQRDIREWLHNHRRFIIRVFVFFQGNRLHDRGHEKLIDRSITFEQDFLLGGGDRVASQSLPRINQQKIIEVGIRLNSEQEFA